MKVKDCLAEISEILHKMFMADPMGERRDGGLVPNPVEQAIGGLREQIREMLPSVESLSPEDIATVFLTYERLIRSNFVPWMTNTWTEVESPVAKEACRDNLDTEVNEDHPTMLKEFVKPVAQQYGVEVQGVVVQGAQSAEPTIAELTRLSKHPIHGLLIMACLENGSLEFIPWMEAAAKKLGLTNLYYLEKHGVADIAHAEEFKNALNAELQQRGQQLDPAAVTHVIDLLRKIFTAKAVQG